MDFLELCELFGGSLFTEEYRGNLQRAQELLSLKEADEISTIFQQACVCMLRGNNQETLQHLTRLEQIPSLAPRWKLRAQTYKLLSIILHRYPPLLRTIPADLNQPWAANIPIAEVGNQISPIFSQYRADVGVDDALSFECVYLLAIISFPGFMRCAQVRHADYPIGKNGKLYRKFAKEAREKLQSLQQMRNMCNATCMQRLGRYITRLEVEILFGIGSPERFTRLQALEEEYRASEDWAGVAACKLLAADFQIASPFSSPLAFNLIPIDRKSVV